MFKTINVFEKKRREDEEKYREEFRTERRIDHEEDLVEEVLQIDNESERHDRLIEMMITEFSSSQEDYSPKPNQ